MGTKTTKICDICIKEIASKDEVKHIIKVKSIPDKVVLSLITEFRTINNFEPLDICNDCLTKIQVCITQLEGGQVMQNPITGFDL